MITKTSDIQELNKIVRNQIIEQSELEPNQVMNGVSIHGQDLLTAINKYAYRSYDLKDSFIVFKLNSRESSSDMSQTKENGQIKYIASYAIQLSIYGLSAQTLANKIVARFRTEYARLQLQEQGVYLENISRPTTSNDFINDTLMIRCEVYINISVEMTIEQVSQPYDMELNDIIVEEI